MPGSGSGLPFPGHGVIRSPGRHNFDRLRRRGPNSSLAVCLHYSNLFCLQPLVDQEGSSKKPDVKRKAIPKGKAIAKGKASPKASSSKVPKAAAKSIKRPACASEKAESVTEEDQPETAMKRPASSAAASGKPGKVLKRPGAGVGGGCADSRNVNFHWFLSLGSEERKVGKPFPYNKLQTWAIKVDGKQVLSVRILILFLRSISDDFFLVLRGWWKGRGP